MNFPGKNMLKISCVILTKNEEKNIKDCIESVKFCDEIIIIDDNSTDRTVEFAKKLGAIVYPRKLTDFASQRNFGLKKAKGDRILFIDADERVSERLKKSISAFATHGMNDEAYYIKRRDFWWGRELKYGETQKVRNQGIIRLVRQNSGKWMGNVHEVFYTAKKIGTLEGFIDHYPHPILKEFIEDINTYSSLRAEELYNKGKSTNILEIMFMPPFKFILNYFIYLGFLDGAPGFAYAFLMSFHSFLVRAKLYQYRSMKHET